ncbi:MAG: Lrp/AsnC family transcriptional regulator [Euryarchaeota archaeon]|nr:Lrp/AsnC family transcriptional regulator [Euryarchaeota archaeon]
MPLELDELDRSLLNTIQWDFPLVERPFRALAEKHGTTEEDAIERVARMKKNRIVRQISAIFDTRNLGYRSSLVAAKFDPPCLDAGARAISGHPGVSHNYRRNHPYNLWFTIAVPPHSRLGLERTVEILGEKSGAGVIRLMPTLRLFKIGVKLDITGEEDPTAQSKYQGFSEKHRTVKHPVTPEDIRLIRALQRDLPLVPEPFTALAHGDGDGLTAPRLLEGARRFQERNQMRRFAAVLHHRRAGFTSNAMGVWAVPAERAEDIGEKMANFNAVSHCYLRPTYEDWPYNIFTMVHARTKPECEKVLDAIGRETGITERAALYSTREYKKVRVEYFTEAETEWEAQHS